MKRFRVYITARLQRTGLRVERPVAEVEAPTLSRAIERVKRDHRTMIDAVYQLRGRRFTATHLVRRFTATHLAQPERLDLTERPLEVSTDARSEAPVFIVLSIRTDASLHEVAEMIRKALDDNEGFTYRLHSVGEGVL